MVYHGTYRINNLVQYCVQNSWRYPARVFTFLGLRFHKDSQDNNIEMENILNRCQRLIVIVKLQSTSCVKLTGE